jgi:HSP20 family protein
MEHVAIQKRPEAKEPVLALFEETRKIFDELQKKAYGLFKERNGAPGSPLDDWIRAEREMFNLPASDLTETDGELRLKAAVPGMKAADLDITATPHELLVRGESESEQQSGEGETRMSELCHNSVFRRYALPAEIEVDKVTAKVADGMLTIQMPKAKLRKEVVKVTAAGAA